MNILVTGGAGFIGSHLVDFLVNNHNVIVIDNLQRGKQEYINPKATFIKADVRNYGQINTIIQNHPVDLIYHLAAHADIRNNVRDDTRMILDQNFLATHNILELMRENNIKKLAFTSTSALYGENQQPNPETNPLIPISIYAASKIASEKLITAYCHTFKLQSWIFRPPNVVGPRGTHGVINDFVYKLLKNPKQLEILGNGKQTKSYLYISDLINAFHFCITHAKDPVNIFNIATGDLVDVTRIAELIIKEMNLSNTPFKYTGGESNWIGDVKCIWLSIDKIIQLGWKPQYNSEQAIQKTVQWAKDHQSLLENPLPSK